jgi:hypothetical protein
MRRRRRRRRIPNSCLSDEVPLACHHCTPLSLSLSF